ncbi:hypothetical protein PM082_014876 [Marasmius tenuissimus]|nr:hypothetical protein PM082_014876 [Marasmius tenuissimus]
MKLQVWLFLHFLSLLPLSYELGAFSFYPLPSTITAFQPQTLRCVREADDMRLRQIVIYYETPASTKTIALTKFDKTQSEGEVTFTVKSISTIDIVKVLDRLSSATIGEAHGNDEAREGTGERGGTGGTEERGDRGDTEEREDTEDTEDTEERGDRGDTEEREDTEDTEEREDTGDTEERGDTEARGDTAVVVNPTSESISLSATTLQLQTTSMSWSLPSNTDIDTSASNNAPQATVIGFVGGAVGFFAAILVGFILYRKRGGRRLHDLHKMAIPHPLSPPPPPILGPYPTERLSTPTSISNRKGAKGSNRHLKHMETNQSIDFRQPELEQERGPDGSSHEDPNRPVGQASYWAMQAQMRLLMQRIERIEAAEQAPPEYVSAYGSSR